jgi:NAD(P)H dehydrogenase (quinone)
MAKAGRIMRMLVCYYSRTQHTQHMADAVAEGAGQVEGVEVAVRPVGEVDPSELPGFDAIVIGSPTYYGTMAAEVKRLIDESVAFHGRLEGKVGGAFTSSANVGGGNETTVMDILKAMLVHGMVVQGSVTGDHYGPVAIGEMDERARNQCVRLGQAVGRLALRLHGQAEESEG